MEKKEKKYSKRFLKESLFKKYSKYTWKDAQEVNIAIFIIYFRLYLI